MANTSNKVNSRATITFTGYNYSITLRCSGGSRGTRDLTRGLAGRCNVGTFTIRTSISSCRDIYGVFSRVSDQFKGLSILIGGTKVTRRGLFASVAPSR